MLRIPLLTTAAAWLLLLPSTHAFGGFYGRAPPEQPVMSTNDAVVYGLQRNTVTLQIQLHYKGATEKKTPAPIQSFGNNDILFKQFRPGAQFGQGGNIRPGAEVPPQEEEQEPTTSTEPSDGPEPFGWILPVPSVPTKVDIGSAVLLDALFQETRPRFHLEILNSSTWSSTTTTCSAEGLTDGCLYTNEGPFRGGPSLGIGGSNNVVEQGTAGIFDYTILNGTSEGVLKWLDENEFTHNPEDLLKQLDQHEGYSFVAVQLNADAPSGAMLQPLMVQYELPPSDQPLVYSVPLMLAHSEGLDLQVYFLSDQPRGRAVPINYVDVVMDDVYVDWVGCHEAEGGDDACYAKDYEQRVQHATEDLGQHSLVTEFAGPSSMLSDKVGVDLDAVAGLAETTSWLEFVTILQDASVPANDALQQVLLKYIPLNFLIQPPFGCSKWKEIYHPDSEELSHEDCFELWYAPSDWVWDPVGLEKDVREQVFLPSIQAQEWIDQFQWLTRFRGYIPSRDVLQKEPHFAITTEAPLVSQVHRATAIPMCADDENPSALEITLLPREKKDAAKDVVTFYQPAVLDCGWQKSQQYIVWNMEQATQTPWSYAEYVIAHGVGGAGSSSIMVTKNESLGVLFDPMELDNAVAFGDELLANLTSVVPLVGSEGVTVVTATTKSQTKNSNPDLGMSASKPADQEQTIEQQVEQGVVALEHDLLRGRASGAGHSLRCARSLTLMVIAPILLSMS